MSRLLKSKHEDLETALNKVAQLNQANLTLHKKLKTACEQKNISESTVEHLLSKLKFTIRMYNTALSVLDDSRKECKSIRAKLKSIRSSLRIERGISKAHRAEI